MGEKTQDRGRLTPLDRKSELLPLRRATPYTRCFLYWIPVSGFPIPQAQRQWLMTFVEWLSELATTQLGLRLEVFLQMKTVQPALADEFLRTALDYNPIIGLSRQPGQKPAAVPTMQDIEDLQKGRKQFDFGAYAQDFCYWFIDKSGPLQRESFFGHGGMTMVGLKPDPKTQAPRTEFSQAQREYPGFKRFFETFDPDRLQGRTFALLDEFLPKSKQLFGGGLEREPGFAGLLFILPLLGTAEFLQQPEEETKKWFELFDVYINESPADKGIVLAMKADLEEPMIEFLRQMRERGLVYPER